MIKLVVPLLVIICEMMVIPIFIIISSVIMMKDLWNHLLVAHT